ncbi:hypothetical protein O6H91_16G079100 [Diphasiastrum complanatum]|uniref:Uncharacterized protein n=1 Tax=Diphasiastrum complanatum TaxID=34168 RepID=A0ACC2BE92_DIPCM|nr:hypothetical protein O6H91_16G079100 [Diphasiastrum complanatum]
MALSEEDGLYGRTQGGTRLSKYNLGPSPSRLVPQHILHIIGRFFRLLSVYAAYEYLAGTDGSVVIFMFFCFLPAACIFLLFQRPWHGRALTNNQVIPSVINGGVMALGFVLWGRGLRACGPVRAILAEYTGAVLGTVSALIMGRSRQKWRKIGGLCAMLSAFYFLSEGWAMSTYSPFSYKGSSISDDGAFEEGHVGLRTMITPILAGLLLVLRRVIARRVALKSQAKKRLHALTVASAVCFLFPVTMVQFAIGSQKAIHGSHGSWAYLSTIIFGIFLNFYVDTYVEERLHVSAASPLHLAVTGSCIIVLELLYGMDFSVLGFLICASILGIGMFEATSVERVRRESDELPGFADSHSEEASLDLSPLPS